MPLVRIDLLQGKPKEYIAAIGESVHRAMVDTIGVPVRDHFQVITQNTRPDTSSTIPTISKSIAPTTLFSSRFSSPQGTPAKKSRDSSSA